MLKTKLFSLDKGNKTGGGVSLFLHDSYQFVNRDDLVTFESNFAESIFIEITSCPSLWGRNVIVGGICRPPNTDIDLFSQHYRKFSNLNQKRVKFVVS